MKFAVLPVCFVLLLVLCNVAVDCGNVDKDIYSEHPKSFKAKFSDVFGVRPTGFPSRRLLHNSFHKYLKWIGSQYAATRKLMGKPLKKQKSAFKQAAKKLANARDEAENMVKSWKHSVELEIKQRDRQQADETEIVGDPYMWQARNFLKQFHVEFASRTTGTPNPEDWFAFIKERYAAARAELAGLHPTGKPTNQQELSLKLAQQRLAKYQNQVLQEVKDWAKEN